MFFTVCATKNRNKTAGGYAGLRAADMRGAITRGSAPCARQALLWRVRCKPRKPSVRGGRAATRGP
jgi:hypothetical protein